MVRAQRLPAIGVTLAVFVMACAAPAGDTVSAPDGQPERPAEPKRIRAAFMSNPPTLNNGVNSTVASGRTAWGVGALEEYLLNVGLTASDERGKLHPRLVEAVPSVENGLWHISPDGQTSTTWRIKPGIQWHDGTPFTADDVLFSARVALDRELPLLPRSGYEFMESVVPADPHTVTVHWKQPFIEADAMFGGRELMPRHVLERTYTEDKVGLVHHPHWSTDFVGLGPFKLREFVLSSHLVLEANDRYTLGRPRIDEIEVRFLPDPNVLAANILAGVVELTIGRALTLQTALQVSEQWRDGRLDIFSSGGTPVHIYPQFINPNPAVIGDVQFRRALLHAINRQEIVDSIMAGKAAIAHGIFWDSTQVEYPEIESSIVQYDYDPQRAMRLIEGLGYARAPDGFFRDSAGQRLSVELRTLTSLDTSVKALFPVADYWQRAGVAVDTLVVPEQRTADREYRATRPGFDMPEVPRDLRRFYSREVPLPENNFRGGNRPRYMNPEFDALLDTYLVTIPWKQRMGALSQVLHHVTDRVVAMGIFFDVAPSMIGNRLVNVRGGSSRSTGSDGVQVWNAHEWDRL